MIKRCFLRLAMMSVAIVWMVASPAASSRAQRTAPPWRGGKGTLREGGIRVPLIAAWPGKIKAGRTSDEFAHSTDLLPTILQATKTQLPRGLRLDGRSLLPHLTAGEALPRRERVFWQLDQYPNFQRERKEAEPYATEVARKGRWKLLARQGQPLELFDLETDPREQTNRIDQEPEVRDELVKELRTWLQATSGSMEGKPLMTSEAPAAQQEEKRYLYVGRAPKDRDGFRDLAPSIEVHDIDDNHRLVKVIPLPKSVYAIRGVCASAATGRLYIAHYGQFKGRSAAFGYSAEGGGRLLCLDLATNRVLWEKSYPPSADRMAITPDGSRIYFPAGEERTEKHWTVINADTGDVITSIPHAARPHNTITSLDGTRAYLQAFGEPEQALTEPGTKKPLADKNPDDDLTHGNGFLTDEERSLAVVDKTTNRIIKRVGPFAEKTRPFTVNGRGTLLFVTVNDMIGFQVGDVATGKVRYTATPPAADFKQPEPTNNGTWSHGIALTADEQEAWIVDQKNIGLHIFDVSKVPQSAPVWKKFIKTRTGRPDIFGQPGWIMSTIDGRYFYPETGEIVDTKRKEIVGQLVGANGKPMHSRFALEVDFRGGVPVRVGDQFAVGHVTRSK